MVKKNITEGVKWVAGQYVNKNLILFISSFLQIYWRIALCLVPLMVQFNIFLFSEGGLCNLLEYFQEKNESKREKESASANKKEDRGEEGREKEKLTGI